MYCRCCSRRVLRVSDVAGQGPPGQGLGRATAPIWTCRRVAVHIKYFCSREDRHFSDWLNEGERGRPWGSKQQRAFAQPGHAAAETRVAGATVPIGIRRRLSSSKSSGDMLLYICICGMCCCMLLCATICGYAYIYTYTYTHTYMSLSLYMYILYIYIYMYERCRKPLS